MQVSRTRRQFTPKGGEFLLPELCDQALRIFLIFEAAELDCKHTGGRLAGGRGSRGLLLLRRLFGRVLCLRLRLPCGLCRRRPWLWGMLLGTAAVRHRHGLRAIAIQHDCLALLIRLSGQRHRLADDFLLARRPVKEYGDDQNGDEYEDDGADDALFQCSIHHDVRREYSPASAGPTT